MASKKVLSIELGVHTTRLCEIEFNGKKRTITNTCVFDTPEGTVEDGYVRNKDILAVSIKAALQKKLIVAKEVIFSIASSKIANREVNMPYLPDNKISEFIKTNAKEYFPIEVEKYVITHKKLEQITDGDTKKLRILVLAAPNDLIETYYGLADTMGLQIISIDYSGNSSYQVLKRQNFKGVNVVVQLNESNTLINIMRGTTLLLQRTVPYGISSVVEAAMTCGEFDIVDKTTALEKLLSDTLVNPKLNESAIDDVALSYMDDNNDAYSQQIKQMKAKDQITDSFNYLVNNTVRVLDYYDNKFKDEKISNVYLAGVGSRIKGILPLFKNEVFKEITKLDNMVGVEFAKTVGISNEEKSDFMVVAGACIEAVAFVPKRYQEDIRVKKTDVYANRIAIVCGIIGIGIFAVYLVQMVGEQTKQASLNNSIKKYAAVEELLNNIEAAEVDYSNAASLHSNTMQFSYVLNVLLEEIEKCVPVGTKLSSFNYTPDSITMEVSSKSYEEAGQFMMGLKKCPLVAGIVVEVINADESEDGTSYNYSVTITPQNLDYSKFIDKDFQPSEESIRKMLGLDEEGKQNEEGTEE